MNYEFDPQISGVLDDGSHDGAIRAAIVRGDLVKMPFRYKQVEQIPAAFAVLNASNPVYGSNGDGSASGIQLTTAAGFGTRYFIRHRFRGSVYGIRYNPVFTSTGGTFANFDVIIDGIPYKVKRQQSEWDGQVRSTLFGDSERAVIVATGLRGDIEHVAEIELMVDGTATTGLALYGYLVEARAGYATPTPSGYFASQAVTTTATAISIGTVDSRLGRGTRHLIFQNATTADIAVTLTVAAVNTVLRIPAGTATIPGVYELKLPGLILFGSNAANVPTVIATAAGVTVNCWVEN